ncbi:MAG: hypothetical protein V1816_28425 [Pseudomonadota bacterium]
MIERRPLGRTGLEISVAALGGHLFPDSGWEYYEKYYGRKILEREAPDLRRAAVEEALAQGVNLVTADFDFELKPLGKALRELDPRRQVLTSVVVGFRLLSGEKPDWVVLEQEIDRIIKTLGRDRLDLPQLRLADDLSRGLVEDLVFHLARLGKKGKIAAPVFYGGDGDPEILGAGLEDGLFNVVTRPLGILNPAAAGDILPLAKKTGAGFIALVPFQKGLLFDCGREAGFSDHEIARAAWGWLLDRPGLSAALFGVSGPEQVRANLDALQKAQPPSPDFLSRLFRTAAYDRFITEMKKHAPQAAVDQRVDHVRPGRDI